MFVPLFSKRNTGHTMKLRRETYPKSPNTQSFVIFLRFGQIFVRESFHGSTVFVVAVGKLPLNKSKPGSASSFQNLISDIFLNRMLLVTKATAKFTEFMQS